MTESTHAYLIRNTQIVQPTRILAGDICLKDGVINYIGQPLESTEGYIFTWLVGYSALLGPIAGILVADYFRKSEGPLKVRLKLTKPSQAKDLETIGNEAHHPGQQSLQIQY